jgi:NAD(P)-dependent dehydrogenase (short-subunit alcohol dehydrogenase family)
MSNSQISGKVAVVTGASRGIGFAVASRLLAGGASVVITGRDETELRKAAARLQAVAPARNACVESVRADVRDYADVEQVMERATRDLGGLDILVNNAGIGSVANVADQSLDAWRDVIDTNLTGVFHCCRAAIPHLRRRGGGWIVSISSLASTSPFAGSAAYCASKAALNAFCESLMQELRYEGIRVTCVLPGSVQTTFLGQSDGPGHEWKLSPDDVARAVVDLFEHERRALPSRVELRPSTPRR